MNHRMRMKHVFSPAQRRLVGVFLFAFVLLSLFAGLAHSEDGWFEDTGHCPACQWSHLALALHLLILHFLLQLIWVILPLWVHSLQPHHYLVLSLRSSRGPPLQSSLQTEF